MTSTPFFHYKNKHLAVELLDLESLAQLYGTPLYVYSASAIIDAVRRYQLAFASQPHLICYAVKANNNLALLHLLTQIGCGFDVVSGGELLRVIRAGGSPKKIVFSGVAKSQTDMELALEHKIHTFNVESESELRLLNEIACANGVCAPISIRINPDIDAHTHHYIATATRNTKFGIDATQALSLYAQAADLKGIAVEGIDCHIGSQVGSHEQIRQAVQYMLTLLTTIENYGVKVKYLDIGGGLGVSYDDKNKQPYMDIEGLAQTVCQELKGTKLNLILEPGRSIIGPAGVLITQIRYLKRNYDKHFAVVDTGMHHFIRPALYQAKHPIMPLHLSNTGKMQEYDIVGPICENADVLAEQCPITVKQGDYLAIAIAGAYGSSMSSQYNSFLRPAEVLVKQDQSYLIRKADTIEDQWHSEQIAKIKL